MVPVYIYIYICSGCLAVLSHASCLLCYRLWIISTISDLMAVNVLCMDYIPDCHIIHNINIKLTQLWVI